MGKPILLVDFDGVIHSYTSGWQGATIVADKLVPGALEFLWNAHHYFDIQIYSSRSQMKGGIAAMKYWLASNYGNWKLVNQIKFPTEKPPAFLTIDDRCIQFTGTWPDVQDLLKFKPWHKK